MGDYPRHRFPVPRRCTDFLPHAQRRARKQTASDGHIRRRITLIKAFTIPTASRRGMNSAAFAVSTDRKEA